MNLTPVPVPVPPPPRQEPLFERLHVLADHPVDIQFSFERHQSRVGVIASIGSHILFVVICVIIARYAPVREGLNLLPEVEASDIVWMSIPGPGGGGGGGGNKAPEPPKKVELPGKEKITVPVKPDPAPVVTPDAPPEELTIPAKPMAAAEQPLVGALTPNLLETLSQGPGAAGGAGTGTGSGIGSGQGSGLGPGSGGGTGGGPHRPGSGVTIPRPLKEVKPQYTADAMRAKVQGTVWVECVVQIDGTVGDVKVVRSLDPVFGLDAEAVKAARQWRFIPGTLKGEPVPVLITIELTFTLR